MTIIASLLDHNAYTLIHIIGIITLFMGFAYGMKSWSKGAGIAHGVGLLLIIFSGMGLVSTKYGNQFQTWMIIKLVIWLALGGALVVVKRKLLPDLIAWILLIVLGAAATWTVIYGQQILVSIKS
jgi:hypothetical protein